MRLSSFVHKTGQAARQSQSGFTLSELLVVVSLLGILAVIGTSGFMRFVHKSRRSEAYYALKTIHADQVTYFGETGGFADTFTELGFSLDRGVPIDERTIEGPYYTYSISALEIDGAPRANFRAIATGDIDPTDPVLDILIIENQLTVLAGE